VKRQKFGVPSTGLNFQFRLYAWIVVRELLQLLFGSFDPGYAGYQLDSLVELGGRRARFDMLWPSNFEHLDQQGQAAA
jgi:hypothetical protein